MEIESRSFFDSVSDACKLSVAWHGYVVTDGSWGQQVLQSPWTKIYFVLDGSAEFICENETVKIEPGYVYVAPCGVPYGHRGDPSVTKLFFHVNLTMPDGQDLFSSPNMRIVRFKRSMEKLEQMREWYRSKDPAKQILIKAELWRAIAEAAAELKREGQNILYSNTVFAAISYIRTHLSAGLTTADVADAVFCSPSGLCGRFKREMGVTVATYIDDLLMFEARRMLVADEKKSIGEISAELGYCDQFYFSRRFAKRFSVTPREYRKLRGAT